MSNRNVLVTLRAEVTGFVAAMEAAGASSKRAEDDIARFSANGSTSLGRLTYSATEHKQAWMTAGTAMLGFGAAVAVGVGYAVKSFADFSQEMALVQTLSHASADEMAQLTGAALNMGQGIGYTAMQVADAEAELIKAGISVKDIMGGALVGSLNLASAGQMDVAQATEIAAEAMTQFKLKGSDVPHIADLLAAGADKALGSVADLGEALKSGGLVAHQFGFSIEGTIGTLALFAQNGLMGEAAGTDLRQMLLKLAAPSAQASDDLGKLGVTLYNSQGHFVGITSLAGQLQTKMQGLSEAERNAMMAHIFGARSIVGANILYQAGAKGVQEWIDKVNDSGFAALQATGKMDSMNGDLKKLQAAWQSSMIEMGAASDSFVRPVIQGVTSVIQQFEKLPEPVKGSILTFGAVVGAAALAGGAFLTITPKIFDVIQGFRTLSGDGSKVATTFGSIAKSAGIATLAIGATLAAAAALDAATSKGDATPSMEQMTSAVLKLSSASKTANLDALFKNWDDGLMKAAPVDVNNLGDAVRRLTHEDGIDGFNKVFTGIFTLGQGKTGLEQVESRMTDLGNTLGNLVTSGNLPQAAQGFNTLSAAYVKNGKSAQDALNAVPGYRDALLQVANTSKVTLTSQELLNYAAGQIPASISAAGASYGTYTDAVGAAQPVTKQMSDDLASVGLSADGTVLSMDKLIGSMVQAGMISISADSAAIAYHKALDDLSASIKTNGHTLDINTAAGRANRTALDAIASSGLQVVQANAKNGDSQKSLTANMRTTYDALVKGAGQFHITGDAADTLARKALGIPKGVKIESAIQNYIDSMLKLEGIGAKADSLNGKTVNIGIYTTEYLSTVDRRSAPTVVNPNRLGGHYATGGLVGFAGGGLVPGIPPADPRRDNVFAMTGNGTPYALRSGEMVVNEFATRKNLPVLQAMNAGADFTRPYVNRTEYASAGGGPQMVTVNMTLDGKVIDSKIINLSTGVAGRALNDFAHDLKNRR